MRFVAVIATVLVVALGITPLAFAKRRAPEPVKAVVHDGVRYEAPVEKMGIVEAFDAATGKKLFEVQVYWVTVDPNLERDVQDVYITKLEVAGGGLLVTDERDRQFLVDLKTRAVRRR
jgi:hypothetical protein